LISIVLVALTVMVFVPRNEGMITGTVVDTVTVTALPRMFVPVVVWSVLPLQAVVL
jgi:hypothetical protein